MFLFFLPRPPLPRSTLFPYTTLFRSQLGLTGPQYLQSLVQQFDTLYADSQKAPRVMGIPLHPFLVGAPSNIKYLKQAIQQDRKSTRLNSSHRCISYAVFCLKKKNNKT